MTQLAPQLAIDPVTGTEVLYAPLRATRSNAFAVENLVLPADEFCPFCPGHENETPPEVYRVPAVGSDPRWQIRCVPNRFPAVDCEDEHSSTYGKHEVLIESDQHHADWLTMSAEHLGRVLAAIAQRLQAWQKDARLVSTQVFKNVGLRAGASLAHPHLQLVGLGFLPRHVQESQNRERAFEQQQGMTYQQYLMQLSVDLMVKQDDAFTTLCPPVSRVPYELWILPRVEGAYLDQDQKTLMALARHLQQVLRQLQAAVGDVAHNLVWHLPPRLENPQSWRMELIPRLTTFAGLELGAQVYINPVRPETAAERLRQATSSLPAGSRGR